MLVVYQFIAALAIAVGLLGTWLAAQHRAGWLICVASSAMWFPALASGAQWVAVSNSALSITICVRNFFIAHRKMRAPGNPVQLPADRVGR